MFEQIRANKRKSIFMVLAMAALLLTLGWFMGEGYLGSGTFGLVAAFIVWIILTLISYNNGDNIFLSISGARKIKYDDHPVLFNIVEEMRLASGLPKMPDIYIIDEASPNAFATGRNPEKASVAVTAGLLETLNRSELQGVIAHELGHIKNRDILYMMMMGVMLGAIVLIADMGGRMIFYGGMGRRRTSRDSGGGQGIMMIVAIVLMIVAPIIAQIIYFALSRKREYLADASAAQFTRYPEALASALHKISVKPQQMKNVSKVVAPSYIVNPMLAAGGKKVKASLFSTHPPAEERIRILRGMGNGAGLDSYDEAFRAVTGKPVGVIPFQTLKQSKPVEILSPDGKGDTQVDRMRDTTDMLWKMNDFGFINCPCGTKLKIPPELAGQRVMCPHCQREHTAPRNRKG